MSDAPAPFRQRLATYIGEARPPTIKHVFTMLGGWLDEAGGPPIRRVLDVGCATGDLLAYLGSIRPDAELSGIDLAGELLDAASRRPELSRANLALADGLAYLGHPCDLVTCFGMLGIFDDCEPLLEQLLANALPGGAVAVQALLNPDDIDVRVAYRDNACGPHWQRGFNVFSRRRVSAWLSARGHRLEFRDVVLPIDLPKRPEQPHRSHTVHFADGSRQTVNGLRQWLPDTLLLIRKAVP